jgi:AbiV family abortive infection protein
MAKDTTEIIKIKNTCLANAESLLSVAERELNKGVDHICFHLALMALEEIGKSILVTIGFTVSIAGKETGSLVVAMDDHIKKIFWALWGGAFRDNKFTKEQIEQSRGLATTLHDKRLEYLYTDPNNPTDPSSRMELNEAENLIKLTRARLELEKLTELKEFEDEDVQNLTWFFKATDDIEKRKFIFSSASIKKLEEVQNGRDWINWIRGVYQKNDEEMRKLAEQEIKRQKPNEKEAFDPKYKMRVKIQSQSHSVRNNAFNKWNDGVKDIKIYRSDKKEISGFAKSELLIDFLFPKAIPIAGLWDHGLFMVKTFVIALNIATKGLFWWNVPKDIEKYFEEVTDLDADKDGNIKIGMAIDKRLAINWEDAHLTLNEEEMGRVSMIFAFLMREHKKLENFLKGYATAMVLFSKTDIHLRLEVNAFDEFFKALKEVLITFGDWDNKSPLKDAILKSFSKLGELKDLEKTIDQGISIGQDVVHQKIHNITLTEVAAIKLYTDFYIQMKANEYFNNLKKHE